MHHILICDDDEDVLRSLTKLLSSEGYAAETFSSSSTLLQRLNTTSADVPDLLLLTVRLPESSSVRLLKQVQQLQPAMPVVIMTTPDMVDDAVHAIRLGANDYVIKPFPKEKILGVLAKTLEYLRLANENRRLREELQRSNGTSIIFRSSRFRQVYDLTLQVASSEASILILGESGTGKELIARTVHNHSLRCERAFISINCAALSDTLLESQLFGHLRGAFTGAVTNQKGLLEEADGGTLFLDEIGDVSPMVQAKLLRVIQEKEFIPIGSTKPKTVDVRFVAATNRDLLQDVADGRFREDLYYRLHVIALTLPPLRERPEDIEPLAFHFLKQFASRMSKGLRGFEPEALELLRSYHWPGNIRELENVIERAVILAQGTLLTPDLLPVCSKTMVDRSDETTPLISLDTVERRHILGVYKQTGFHKSKAAQILDISRKTLDRKLAGYNVG